MDPGEAPQNVGLYLSSELFDNQIIYRHEKLVGNKHVLQILKKKKEIPSIQRVNYQSRRNAPKKISAVQAQTPPCKCGVLAGTKLFSVLFSQNT